MALNIEQEHTSIQEKYKNLFEATGTGIGVIELDGTISLANKKLAEILEIDLSKVINSHFLTWIYSADKEMLIKYNKARLNNRNDVPQNYEFRLQTHKGNIHWVSIHISFSHDTGVTLVSILDIHKFKQMERELKETFRAQNAIFSAIPDLMFELDASGRYINVWANNPQELARNKELLLGKTVSEVLPTDASKQVMLALTEAKESGQAFGQQIQIDTPDGVLWFELSVSLIDSDSDLEHFILLSRNITKRKHLEEQLKHISDHDPLTNLYNRRRLDTKLSKESYKADRYDTSLSLLMFDIDYFKKVNDTYGHQVGDKVLQVIANILLDSFRETDEAFRYGGEEFVVTLENTSIKKAEELAQRLRDQIENTFIELDNGEKINVTVSIGVSSLNHENQSASELLMLADERMYAAKQSGRNRVVCA